MSKLDSTKYAAMVANAASKIKVSSTVFKNFIADLKSVIEGNDDLRIAHEASATPHAAATNLVKTDGSNHMTGNLTVESSIISVGKSTGGFGGNIRLISDDGVSRWFMGLLGTVGATEFNIRDTPAGLNRITIDASGKVTIVSGDLSMNNNQITKVKANLMDVASPVVVPNTGVATTVATIPDAFNGIVMINGLFSTNSSIANYQLHHLCFRQGIGIKLTSLSTGTGNTGGITGFAVTAVQNGTGVDIKVAQTSTGNANVRVVQSGLNAIN